MSSIRIEGKKIAEEMLLKLQNEVQSEQLHPHLLVFLIGDNPSSQSYIRQKKKAAEQIGATCTITQLPADTSAETMKAAIHQANIQKKIHGIIIQRPLPPESTIPADILDGVEITKDIDGFLPNSPFDVPVAKAVITILETIYHSHFHTGQTTFIDWLRNKTLVVIGKGVTAGGPIRTMLELLTIPVVMVDRSTANPHALTKKADIIISCTGKPRTITSQHIKDKAILISVGLTKGEDGKIHGDYEEDDIQEKAFAHTPTPGGVGPINVACLMQNLVKACKMR